MLEGLRGQDSIAELSRREDINADVYYRWSKEFLEAGKKRLAGDTVREATADEVRRFVSYFNHERYHESLQPDTGRCILCARRQIIRAARIHQTKYLSDAETNAFC